MPRPAPRRAPIPTMAVAALALAGCGRSSEPIAITGSSTVAPFTKAVADAFAGASKDRPAPMIQSTGTIAGIKSFCAGPDAPDLLDASRRIARQELATCRANRVGDVMEIPIGLDGIALAESDAGPQLAVTDKDLYLALAAAPMGKPNTARQWRDVDPKLPAIPIKLLGPPASSGTRDSFVTLILEPGCAKAMPEAAALRASADTAKYDQACRRLRADGPYVEGSENYDATATALTQDHNAVGLFGYSYLEKSAGKLHGVPINGAAPNVETISHGGYPGVRQLFLYVKKGRLAHKPAIQEFLNLYATMWKPGGPLAKIGLIPLSGKSAERSLATIQNGFPLETDDLP